jgi:hypothetical protein
MWEFWERTGCCWRWRATITFFYTFIHELALGCWLACCVSAVPVLGLSLLVWKYLTYMMPTQLEGLRCCSEALLLCSLWQGQDTNSIAVLGFLAWCCNLHCSRDLQCRGCTWLVVCLAQKDWRITKLALLFLLASFAPLYGKRASTSMPTATNKTRRLDTKEEIANEAVHDQADKKLSARQSELLRSARSHTRGPNVCAAELYTDIATRFAFVPALLLAVLVGVVIGKGSTRPQNRKTHNFENTKKRPCKNMRKECENVTIIWEIHDFTLSISSSYSMHTFVL